MTSAPSICNMAGTTRIPKVITISGIGSQPFPGPSLLWMEHLEISGPSPSHRVGGRVEFNPKEGTSKNSGREASEAAIREKWKEKQNTADPADDDFREKWKEKQEQATRY